MARRSDVDALDALLEGGPGASDAPRSVERLASLATAVREHTAVEAPSDEFRARLRAELLEVAAAGRPTLATRARDRVEEATAGLRHSVRTAGVAAVASTMIGATGVAAAAQSALPGDVLYSVKSLTEDARLALATGDVDRGRLHLAFARERLDEVEAGSERLAPDTLRQGLDRMDAEAAAGADELLQAVAEQTAGPEVLEELDDFTAELRGRILELTPDLPLSVQPAAERTLEVLRRIDLQVGGLVGISSCESCGGVTGLLPRVVLPGDGPAAPPCQCVGDVTGSIDGDPGVDAPAPVPSSQDDPAAPAGGTGGDPVPATPEQDGGSGGLGGVATEVGDTVGDVGSGVDDVVDEVVEPLEDVGSIVDELLQPSASESSSGGVGDVVGDVGDTVDGVGDVVEDTASEVGSEVGGVVDDLTGPLDEGLFGR